MGTIINPLSDAAVDVIETGPNKIAHGGVAQRLLNNSMNVNALRTNTTLRYDEWKLIDTAVRKIALQRLPVANDLISRGLVYNIPNGMGSTLLQWETLSDFEDASISMDGQTRRSEDRPNFVQNYLPLPICHKDFSISSRTLAASRKTGEPLDTTMAELAMRKVTEKVERMILGVSAGADTYTFSSGTIYGYYDHVYNNDVTLSEGWDDSSCTGDDIIEDILSMITALNNDRHYGPFMLYVPTAWGVQLAGDLKAASDRTIRERIEAIDVIAGVRVADQLTANHVLMVEMSPDVVKLAIGLQPTVVEWEEQGGTLLKFKVMTIMVPWIRPDQDNRLGICLGTHT